MKELAFCDKRLCKYTDIWYIYDQNIGIHICIYNSTSVESHLQNPLTKQRVAHLGIPVVMIAQSDPAQPLQKGLGFSLSRGRKTAEGIKHRANLQRQDAGNQVK